MLHTRITQFYDYILDGDPNALASLFPYEPVIKTPLYGQIIGAAALEKFVSKQQTRLINLNAKSEITSLIYGDDRLVAELTLHFGSEGKATFLPIVLVAELIPGGVSAIQTYHGDCSLING